MSKVTKLRIISRVLAYPTYSNTNGRLFGDLFDLTILDGQYDNTSYRTYIVGGTGLLHQQHDGAAHLRRFAVSYVKSDVTSTGLWSVIEDLYNARRDKSYATRRVKVTYKKVRQRGLTVLAL